MAIYYINTLYGDNSNDGLSENKPLKDETGLTLHPGDTVLFKRGNFVRGRLHNVCGESGKPITYGAYGEGEKPIFCGSVSLNEEKMWYETEKNIWVCEAVGNDEVGNFVFDNNSYGTLRWTKNDLKEQGDFYDECFGLSESHRKKDSKNYKIYLYSFGNPASVYKSIECVTYGDRALADNGHDMVFKDLKFINSGVHAIAGCAESKNIKIENCEFENIGGCVWDYESKIRFGNAVEFWDIAENIEISHCIFNNIYDSAVTHQGMQNCKPANGFSICDNVFIKCGMAAYEQRDKMPIDSKFNDNVCLDAGEGFSKQGEIMPRYSEIWPQPMGHHVFLWRIEEPTDGGGLEIKNNVFYNAPYGASIYSIISQDAEKQIELAGNTYYTENRDLINRWGGENYKNFEEYKDCEQGCRYEKVYISTK